MFKFGFISKADPEKGMYSVTIDEDDIVTKMIPVVTKNSKGTKVESPLKVGEHVAVLMDAHFEDGVILGAVFSEKDTPAGGAGENVWRTTFEDGSYISFNKSSGTLTVNTQGKVVIQSASDVEITCTKLKVTGNVEITGSVSGASISATGNIETSTGDVKAGIISLKTHKHPDLTSGGTTGTPIP